MRLKSLVIAAAVLLGSGGLAAAAVASTDLNMRSGPGTNYRVINVIPGGARVNVLGCRGSWCRVSWGASVGYASRGYLGGGVGAPAVVVRAPVYRYGYPYRSRYAYPSHYGYRYGWHYRYGWPARRYYRRHH